MAKSPDWKIYDSYNEYQASCKNLLRAIQIATLFEDGATVRYGHKIVVWTEGSDGRAADSYDDALEIAIKRLNDWSNKRK